MPGLMLETQNNTHAACLLYEKHGFRLGGIDRFLYRGIDPRSREIALFWYLDFNGSRLHPSA
jgi:ribosomal protein S18 acetylase RimI-like enzyme